MKIRFLKWCIIEEGESNGAIRTESASFNPYSRRLSLIRSAKNLPFCQNSSLSLTKRFNNNLIVLLLNFVGVLPFILVAKFILLNINLQFQCVHAFPLFHVGSYQHLFFSDPYFYANLFVIILIVSKPPFFFLRVSSFPFLVKGGEKEKHIACVLFPIFVPFLNGFLIFQTVLLKRESKESIILF